MPPLRRLELRAPAPPRHPHDLRPGEFLTGGEAWIAFRRGEIDDSTFGVHGTENWGAAEIRGNAVKDLAALNKVESLPWDEWGRMTEVCATDDPAAVSELYAHKDLRAPDSLVIARSEPATP